ncbi:aminoacyl-tRNA hydrolase [Candidatus Falkowbacteria bacterium]|nr:aminoacyl-tRNA hydrolase [Candidatus Falkowbacteria bacterium]
MKIIVGLGNPGEKYKNTKHNAGFIYLDLLAREKGLEFEDNKKLKALIAKDGDTIYIKPQTYMNESGRSVAAVLSYYKLVPKSLGIFKTKDADLSEILTVAHDDIDLPLGKYKLSTDSRSAGHRGVESIIRHLKTKNFKRIRIGIYNEDKKRIPIPKLVLSKFDSQEKKILEETIKDIALSK